MVQKYNVVVPTETFNRLLTQYSRATDTAVIQFQQTNSSSAWI